MSIKLEFRFQSGKKALAMLNYDHFGHGKQGKWYTTSNYVGKGNDPTEGISMTKQLSANSSSGQGSVSTNPLIGAGGDLQIEGSVCYLYEQDSEGARVLVAKLKSFPSLGGLPDYKIDGEGMSNDAKYLGLFEVYRWKVPPGASDGAYALRSNPVPKVETLVSDGTTAGPAAGP